jgi:hypothetical protein
MIPGPSVISGAARPIRAPFSAPFAPAGHDMPVVIATPAARLISRIARLIVDSREPPGRLA